MSNFFLGVKALSGACFKYTEKKGDVAGDGTKKWPAGCFYNTIPNNMALFRKIFAPGSGWEPKRISFIL